MYEDEYSPEFGSVVIRDATAGDVPQLRAPVLIELAGPLWGTVAWAGAGWLQLSTHDGCQRVRIEAHDAAPPPESEA